MEWVKATDRSPARSGQYFTRTGYSNLHVDADKRILIYLVSFDNWYSPHFMENPKRTEFLAFPKDKIWWLDESDVAAFVYPHTFERTD